MKNYGTIENAKDITTKEYVDEKVETGLADKADKAEIPTKTSELENDSGYLTEHQDLSGYLPLSGGMMSGSLRFNNTDTYIEQYSSNFRLNSNYSSLTMNADSGMGLKYSRLYNTSSGIFNATFGVSLRRTDGHIMFDISPERINVVADQSTSTSNPKPAYIGNLKTPISSTDAANKQYVDDTLSTHTSDTTIHVTEDEKTNWNNKANSSDVPTKTSELENDSNFVTSDEVSKNVWYGTCTISASAPSKTVTTTNGDFVLEVGNIVVVYFKNTTTVVNPTLNVDGTGEKSIYVSGGTSATSTGVGFPARGWSAGSVIAFVYDGARFRPTSISSPASTTRYGLTQLSTLIDSTSTTQAATPSAVKQAYDLANSKAARASYTATLSTSWSGTSAPYTQEVAISGILATDKPHIMPIYSDTNATAILEKKAWNMVGKAVTSAGKITFTCFEEKPEQAVSLAIEVIR